MESGWRNDFPVHATSAATSITTGSTSVRWTRPLSLLNLFSEVSLISSGHGCAGCAGRSWRPSSRPTRVESAVDRPTIRSTPSTGKPAMIACGCGIGPMTAAQTASKVVFVFNFNQEREPSYGCDPPLKFPVKFNVLNLSGRPHPEWRHADGLRQVTQVRYDGATGPHGLGEI